MTPVQKDQHGTDMWLVAGSGHWSINCGNHTDTSKFRNGGYLEWGAKLEGFDEAGVVRCAAKTKTMGGHSPVPEPIKRR
jgi:hypothetical protein